MALRISRRNAKGLQSAHRDFIILCAFAILVLALAVGFDIFDRFTHWYVQQEEPWELEEILVVIFVLSFGFGIFSYRRWKELSREVIERERVESDLREKSEWIRVLMDTLPNPLFYKDANGRYVGCNKAFEDFLGTFRAEIIGRDVYGLDRHHEFADKVKAKDEELFRNPGLQIYEWVITNRHGEPRNVLVHRATLSDPEGRVSGIVGIIVDITDHKRVESALRESETRWQYAIEGAGDGLWDWNVQTNEVFFSRHWKEMLGFEDQEIGTSPDEWDKRIHPEDKERVFADLNMHLNGHTATFDSEHRLLCKDGAYKWILDRGKVISRSKDGKPVRMIGTHSDIDHRKKVQAALEESEKRLRRAEEVAHFGNWEYHLDSGQVRTSDGARLIYGLDGSEDPADVFKIPLPEFRAMLEDALRGLVAEGKPYNVEFKIRRPTDGKIVHIHSMAEYSEEKRIVFGVIQDVTESREAKLALEDEYLRRRILFEQSRDGIAVIDDTGGLFEANAKYAEMLGYSMEELRDLYVWDWDVRWSREELEKQIRSIDVSGAFFETLHRRKDGTIYDVEISANAAVFSGRKLVFCVCRDISQRKATENALRESDAFIKVIIENLPIGLAVNFVQPARKLAYMNDYFPRYYRTTREALADPDCFWEVVYQEPEFRESLKKRVMDDCASGDPDRMFWPNIPISREGEETFYVSARNIYIPDRRLMLSIVWDVTGQVRADEERKRLEERLRRAEKMEAMGTMAGGVAHDLNNVLGIIVGYSEMLLYDLDESSPESSLAQEIHKGGQRAAAIVQDLLTLARRGVPSTRVMNLNKVLMDCQKSPEFKKLCSFHPKVRVNTDFEPNLLNIGGSSVHLEKSFMNLVANAAESMESGGVITVTTRNQYLDKPVVGYDEVKEGDYVVLSISDEGEGIAPGDLERIFEPFYTRKVMGRSGTGLGLAVVWGTVKDHNGYINVESVPGEGTTFTLFFPVTREEQTPEQISISVSEYMGKGETILVVDDIREQRELAAAMLKKMNYNVTSFSSGEEAVEYLKHHEVDLVVLDMIMEPGMDGLNTYAAMSEIHPGQKAIIVSGFAETDRVSSAQSLGAGAYVKKPYVLEKLALAVRQELDGVRRAQR